MKHYLNFRPTVFFRKGSSFMLKTSLVILYLVTLTLAGFWLQKYQLNASLYAFYTENDHFLKPKVRSLADKINKLKPPAAEVEEQEKFYADYRRVAAVGQTSWTCLLDRLEKLVPAEMRFKRVSITPGEFVRVRIDGETIELNYLTAFLRELFDEQVFAQPNLRSHARVVDEGMELINFSLEVDYIGEKGELP